MAANLASSDIAALHAFMTDTTLWRLSESDDVSPQLKAAVADLYQAKAQLWRVRAARQKGGALHAALRAELEAADRLALAARGPV